jgi:myo-inositol 2-dehydrogenase/D-chiro-inositol 1-dehydrogenase
MTVVVGLIGAGIMGADHANTLASSVARVRIRAIADADLARAESVAQATGADVATVNPMAIIDDPAIHAILIASPDHTHRDLTLACVAARKPVLCEKPLAPTARECLDVVSAEVGLGRRLVQVGYMRRFDPAYVEVKKKLASGELGSPTMFHCVHRNLSAPPWFDSKMSITNSAVHEIDVSRWLLEEELAAVQVFRPATSNNDAAIGPVFLVFETSSNHIVTVENNNNGGYGYDVRGELVCEKGTISLRSPINSEFNFNLVQGTIYPGDWRQRFATAYRQQLQDWIRSIETGAYAGASAWDGYAASAVAEAALESLSRGRSTKITLEARPSLYT